MKFIFRAIIYIIAIFVTDWLLPGIAIKTLEAGLMVYAALTLINLFIKPVVKFFTFPITLITLGTFNLFLNTVFIILIAFFVDGFKIYYETYIFGFVWAFAFGLLLSIVNLVLEQLAKFIT